MSNKQLSTQERIARLDERVRETQDYLNQQVLKTSSKYPGMAPEALFRQLADECEWQNEMYEGRAGSPSIPFNKAVAAISDLTQASSQRALSPSEEVALDFLCLLARV